MKRRFSRILAIAMATMLLAGCGGGKEETGTAEKAQEPAVSESTEASSETPAKKEASAENGGEEKVVTMATVQAWNGMSPLSHTNTSQFVFMSPIYNSLFSINAKGEVENLVGIGAEQNEDGTVVTVKLNPDAKWHDGEKVTANDVVFTYRILSNPDIGLSSGRYTYLFTGTDDAGYWSDPEELGVKALDEETVEFTLKPEMVTSLENLCFRGVGNNMIFPEHCLKDVPAETFVTDPFWDDPVGCGAFKLDKVISGERMEYVANKDYFLGAPDFDRLIIRVIPSANMLSALISGEIDTTALGSELPYTDFQMASQDPNLYTSDADGFANEHILINNEKLEQNVRKAIDCAIDKEMIVNDAISGAGRVAISAIVPENPYRLEGIEGNAYDPERAKELLAEAGWDSGRTLNMMVKSDNIMNQNAAALIQQQLAAVGINVEIETLDFATMTSRMAAGEYDLAIAQSASNPFEPSESRFYFQLVPVGWLRLTDTSWLDLYDAGNNGRTIEERKPYYDELQRRLVDEVPMIFLYHRNAQYYCNKRITNVVFDDFPFCNYKFWTWKVE